MANLETGKKRKVDDSTTNSPSVEYKVDKKENFLPFYNAINVNQQSLFVPKELISIINSYNPSYYDDICLYDTTKEYPECLVYLLKLLPFIFDGKYKYDDSNEIHSVYGNIIIIEIIFKYKLTQGKLRFSITNHIVYWELISGVQNGTFQLNDKNEMFNLIEKYIINKKVIIDDILILLRTTSKNKSFTINFGDPFLNYVIDNFSEIHHNISNYSNFNHSFIIDVTDFLKKDKKISESNPKEIKIADTFTPSLPVIELTTVATAANPLQGGFSIVDMNSKNFADMRKGQFF